MAVTAWLQQHTPYLDPDRTAIWGWSYGGYLSLSALTRDTASVFRCGASVAPVVRWEVTSVMRWSDLLQLTSSTNTVFSLNAFVLTALR